MHGASLAVAAPIITKTKNKLLSEFLTIIYFALNRGVFDHTKIYEALIFWRGRINAAEFADVVGRTRQQVQTEIITPFVEGNLDLQEQRGRKHGRTLLARPKYAPEGLWTFFNLITAERTWRRVKRHGTQGFAGFNVIDLAPPPEAADSAVMVSRAASQRCALMGNYLFKNHGVRAVSFSPHVMIRTPRRIHFRGHLLVQAQGETQNWGYVDLVPGRFLNDGSLMLNEFDYRGADADGDWHEKTIIAFEINPALPKDTYLALQQEHEIEADQDGRCRIQVPTRKALVYSYEHHVFDRTIGPDRMRAWIRCAAIDC